MREMNFFNPYLSHRKTIKVGQVQVILAFVFVLLVCGSIYSFNMIRFVKYNLEIRNYQAFMTDPANMAAVKKYTETKQKVDIMNQYLQGLAPIEAAVEARSALNGALINKLNTAIPHEIYLEKMNVTIEQVLISGVGTSRNVIAQYQHNLLKLGIFKDVFINIIEDKSEGSSELKFVASCTLAGGASNEAKQ